jgi:nickel/cobalt transporter (NiCoT) family protein
MRFTTNGLFDDGPDTLRSRIVGIYCLLFLFNAGSWIWAVMAFAGHPALLGTAFLAYSLGLRHAVDADHIAAIDNVTRKLMHAGKRPVGVGFLFSLGHSTIVLAGAAAIAGMALTLQNRIAAIRAVGTVVGTLVSTVFLFAIAMVNLLVLRSTYRAFVKVRSGACYQDQDFDTLMGNRGCLSRVFRPIFRMIERSRHMYALGLLFVLGFDTATEIGLLGISASEASKGVSLLQFHPRFPSPFCSRHVAHRHHRQHPHVGCIWMGVREACSQAVLQHDDYGHFRNRCTGSRGD